jgi:hypothetical protein
MPSANVSPKWSASVKRCSCFSAPPHAEGANGRWVPRDHSRPPPTPPHPSTGPAAKPDPVADPLRDLIANAIDAADPDDADERRGAAWLRRLLGAEMEPGGKTTET